MCPTDTTPDPRDMQRAPDEPEFLQPREHPRADEADKEADAELDISPLPERAGVTAVDIEDEEADPVGSEQPSLSERLKSDSELQRG
jgi:hypothetical protein